jgi:3-deoxy-D-manno-octulosonic-acid transferase
MSSSRVRLLWWGIHNFFFIPLMFGLFHLAAFLARIGFGRFTKIRAGLEGRQALFDELAAQLQQIPSTGLRFWIHAASMGEYEQARPLLHELGRRFPGAVRVLTFFSPSAYANIKRANIPAEVVSYLPFDSLRQVRRFLRMVNPIAAIIVRHDLWPNHLWEAKRRGAVLVLANASVSVKARSWRHRPVARQFNRALFDCFDAICAVSEKAARSLDNLVRYPDRLVITGDSRYDQVLFRSQAKKIDDLVPEEWREGGPLFIAGSTWPSDEDILLPAFVAAQRQLPQLRMILVPHEPTVDHVAGLEKHLASYGLISVRLSQIYTERVTGGKGEREKTSASPLSPFPPFSPSVLLVDRVGILANLYGIGQVAFVGGGFGPGVHNVLEAAVHGVPVLVGPRFRNSPEAIELAENKLLTPIVNAEECQQNLIELFQNTVLRQERGARHREFVLARCGASAKVIDILAELLEKRHPGNRAGMMTK